jgi:malonyl-CoA O-methyltransferase
VSLFVAGTGAGVGKTLVAALLMARYRREVALVYWQPIATGAALGRDRATLEMLVPGASTAAEAYLFADPVAPYLAARREGDRIEGAKVLARWRELRAIFPGAGFLVEGTGGPLEPLDDGGLLLADLMIPLALPVLLVARAGPGAVNHTLLALEALRRRELAVAGVVLSGPPDADDRRAIERCGEVEVVGEVPLLEQVDAPGVAAAAAELDTANALRPWLARAS